MIPLERAAATCAAKDIATVKRTVADPVYFCQWWQQDVRTRSPFMEFSATQVDTLCKCISPVATGPKCKRKQADNIYNQETGDLYDQEAHIDQYAEAYINKHEEAYLDKHKETHLDKHKEIYLDEHDEACIDQHEEGYNYDINEREASHIGKLKEAHDNHDEASNNQSQGFNFKHQESFNNQLKEMSTLLLLSYCHSAEITIMVQVIAPAWKHSNSVREPAKLKASFPDPTARRRP
ncbi:unnamed protein product [Aureobasidium pullulans]|nr:unnamed protein product [Aureobasidium pullulans]